MFFAKITVSKERLRITDGVENTINDNAKIEKCTYSVRVSSHSKVFAEHVAEQAG